MKNVTRMTEAKMMELAAKAGLVAIVGGKIDASYAPPENIKKFARLVMEEFDRELPKQEAA